MAARLRENILTMSLGAVSAVTAAFNSLKLNGSYDGFVRRHMDAMMVPTPPGSQSNAAHRGPIFLPWHRAALWELETLLIQADPSIAGLPYWRWEVEGALNAGRPQNSRFWTADYVGTDGDSAQGNRVLNGPFKDWQATIYDNGSRSYTTRSTAGLVRRLGRDPSGSPNLPDQAQVTDALSYTKYDVSPYQYDTNGFRGRIEGWAGGPRMHNLVHRWVGGDMLSGTSPNDPVFWLHHCNVDRLWWSWQTRSTPLRPYAPISPDGPIGQRSGDQLTGLLGTSWTAAAVQDIRNAATLGYSFH